MKRLGFALAVAGIMSFLVVFLLAAPARAVTLWLPDDAALQLKGHHGTLWRGTARLYAHQRNEGTVRWQLSALPLLQGRLQAVVGVDGSRMQGTARIGHGLMSGQTEINNLHGDVALALLADFTGIERVMDANLRLDGVSLALAQGFPTAASGRIAVNAATALYPRRMLLGQYILDLQMNGDLAGFTLADAQGPVLVTGGVWLGQRGDWLLDLRVRLTEDDRDLRTALEFLGAPNPDGWYPVFLRGVL